MKMHLMILLASLVVFSGVAGCSTSGSKASYRHAAMFTASMLSDAKLLYEMGKLDAAEQKLREVLKTEPDNPAAGYLLSLVEVAQYMRQTGRVRPWGYIQTYPPQPIYR